MHPAHLIPLATLVVSAVAFGRPAQQVTPKAPAIWREVTGVMDITTDDTPPIEHDPVFTRPHMPAWRTTSDGRIGIRVEQPGNTVEAKLRIGLMKPELLQQPLLTHTVTLANAHDATMFDPVLLDGVQQDGITPIDWDGSTPAPGGDHWEVVHACLWDDADILAENGKDVYQVKVVVTTTLWDEDGVNPEEEGSMRVCTTPIEVVVANPKTPTAYVESVTQNGTQSLSPIWSGPTPENPLVSRPLIGFGFEPTVAYDGRLLVLRVSCGNFTWNEPNSISSLDPIPHTVSQDVDIVYAWSTEGGSPADASKWGEVLPITFAPYDHRINTLVGFALEPFRDAKGNPIDHLTVYDSGATYPWVDREADNLMFETIFDTLSKKVVGTDDYTLFKSGTGRYEYEEVPVSGNGYDPLSIVGEEDQWRHQGIAVIGKWTHGKLVQLDNLNNDCDFAIGSDNSPNESGGILGPQRRLVKLYQPDSVPATTSIPSTITSVYSQPDEGKILLGYGRSTVLMPQGENDNANIIDSIENKLNYRKHARPIAYRDIVWHVNNSKYTDQHVFDDSLDPDALIVANMTGALEFTLPSFTGSTPDYHPYFKHHTGWSAQAQEFLQSPQLQNSATALPSRWTLPTHGQVLGDGRIEPIAQGGVYGKGFWMVRSIGVQFTIPTQTGSETLAGKDWYLGLFVDARFPDDATTRRLITFPDGASLRLRGRKQILLVEPGGDIAHRATIPDPLPNSSPWTDLLPEGGWAHLALQLREGGRDVEILLDGLPLSRWESDDAPLFEVSAGDLLVGSTPSLADGITGWIDDFKLLAHTVDPETACNHAGGTLIGLQPSYSGVWKGEFADRFPAWSHAQISAALVARGETATPLYANYLDYRKDYGNDPQSLANLVSSSSGGVVPMRERVHFPEGPLYFNAPRPFSKDNRFCLSCHHNGAAAGLDLAALDYDPSTPAVNDFRRQPSQPPAKIHGVIPAGLVDTVDPPLPASTSNGQAGGFSIDRLMLPNWLASSGPNGKATVVNFTVLDAATEEELMTLDSLDGSAANPPFGQLPFLDPAVLGTEDVILRVNLDSAQFSVAVQLDQLTPVNLEAPYHFAVDLGALTGGVTHNLKATPLNGTMRKCAFNVHAASGSERVVAEYQEDFQASSPAPGWLYGWNAHADLTQPGAFRAMNWYALQSRYNNAGLPLQPPIGNLNLGYLDAAGGHPGRGTFNGSSVDRFVLSGYRVRFPGEYSVSGELTLVYSNSNGVEVRVLHQSGSSLSPLHTVVITETSPPDFGGFASVGMQPGDILWVAVGPNGTDANDFFTFDFDVLYDESSF